MIRRVLATCLLVVWLAVPASATPVESPGDCQQLPQLRAHGSMDGDAAVVLVHGWTGSPDMWDEPVDRAVNRFGDGPGEPFAELVQRIDRLDAWTLDYHDVSGRWVTAPGAAADLLERAVVCLSDGYGNPVAIVAHSMGGLATREVVDRVGTEHVSAVVTLGTPHTGSDQALAGAALLGANGIDLPLGPDVSREVPIGPLAEAVWVCGKLTHVDVDGCGPWLQFLTAFDGEAGQALRTGSPELAALPDFPDDLPTLALGSQVEIQRVQRTLFGLQTERLTVGWLGDIVVPARSSTAQGRDSQLFECGHTLAGLPDAQLLEAVGVAGAPANEQWLDFVGTPCAHWSYHRTVEISNQAIFFLIDNGTPAGAPTFEELKSADIPPMCGHDATTLVDGRDVEVGPQDGFFELADVFRSGEPAWVRLDDTAAGPMTVIIAACNLGGVGLPNQIMAFGPGGAYHAHTDLWEAYPWDTLGLDGPARDGVKGLRAIDDRVEVTVRMFKDGEGGCCSSGYAVLELTPTPDGLEVTSVIETGTLADGERRPALTTTERSGDLDDALQNVVDTWNGNDEAAARQLMTDRAYDVLSSLGPGTLEQHAGYCMENGHGGLDGIPPAAWICYDVLHVDDSGQCCATLFNLVFEYEGTPDHAGYTLTDVLCCSDAG